MFYFHTIVANKTVRNLNNVEREVTVLVRKKKGHQKALWGYLQLTSIYYVVYI